jgi:hypothetical protein
MPTAPGRRPALALLALLASTIALACGCGGSARLSAPAGLRLQRQHLAAMATTLRSLRAATAQEVSAAKAAWPLIAHGLPHLPTPQVRAAIAAAQAKAQAIVLPPLLHEGEAVTLTGPAAQIAGLYRSYLLLSERGWRLIEAAIDQIQAGSPSGARFARDNVDLYIESVYDGHFTLAQIGKKLSDGYANLGGAKAFASSLTQSDVDALAGTYSEAVDRLDPHVTARLGS